MRTAPARFSLGRPLLAGGLAFVAAAALAATVIARREGLRRANERAQVELLASEHAHALQRTIERAASATYALAALVRQGRGTVDDFEGMARRLLPFYPDVAALGLAPGGVVRVVSPLAANRGSLGLDWFRDPTWAKEAAWGRDTGRLTLAGPFPLVQGGEGVVARLPVDLDDASGAPVFWGFVFTVLRVPDLLESARIAQLGRAGLGYELSRVSPGGGERQVIVAAGPRSPVDPVWCELLVPDGVWRLRVAPVAGWNDPLGLAVKGALGVLFSTLVGAVAKLVADLRVRQRGLAKLVARRTAELQAREAALNRAQAVAQVGSWVAELAGDGASLQRIEWSRETFRIFGVAGDQPLDFGAFIERVHADDRDRLRATWAAARGTERMAGEFRIVAEEATRWVCCQAEWEPGTEEQSPRWVGTVQEITAQRLAEQELRESQQRLAFALEGSNDGLWDVQLPAGGVYLSPRGCEILGFAPDDLPRIAAIWSELVHPEDLPATRAAITAYLEGSVPRFEVEQRLRTADGGWKWVLTRGKAVARDASGAPTRMVGTHTDISVRREAEAARVESEESLAITLQSIGDAVIATDAGGRITRMNPAAERLTGWPRAEAQGRPLGEVWRIVNARTREPMRDPVERVLTRDEVVALTDPTALIARDGTEYQIADTAAPMRDAQGRALGVVLVFSDVTEQFRVQEALRESEARARRGEERLELAVDGADLGLWDWDVVSGALEFNDRWCRMLGYERTEVSPHVDAWDRMLHPEDRARVWEKLGAHLRGDAPNYESEHRLRHRAGHWVWILDRGKVMARDASGAPLRMNGTHMDLTARREAEEALRASLRETEALLKEVHHRVKNNLQVIASLLRLEAGRIGHPLTQAVLQDMQNRIRSMALLHETLYRSGSFAQVDLAVYLRGLCRHLFRSIGGSPARPIELKLDVAPVSLAVDLAVPCGLIVSELASNCLKHGFPDGQPGEVCIALESLAGGTHLRLRVSDTGVGLPPDFAARQERSLGLQLVGDLARQLRGHLEVGAGPAAVFEVTFPVGGAEAPPGTANT